MHRFSTTPMKWRALWLRAAVPPSAGRSTPSIIGCGWPDRVSTPRSLWNSWGSSSLTCARDWLPRGRSAAPHSIAINPNSRADEFTRQRRTRRAGTDSWREPRRTRVPAARTPAIDPAPCIREQRQLHPKIRRGECASERPALARRPGPLPLHDQGGPEGRLSLRLFRGAQRTGGAYSRLLRHHRQADGGGLHAERFDRLGQSRRTIDTSRLRPCRHDRPRRVRLWYV